MTRIWPLLLGASLLRAPAQFTVRTIGGTPKQCGFTAGPATTAQLHNPGGIATWAPGVWLIADFYNGMIRNLTSSSLTIAAGATQSGTCPTYPTEEGLPASSAHFVRPVGVAADGAGGFIVSDSNCGSVRRVSAAGVVSTMASSLLQPQGLTAPASGSFVLLAESGSHVIRRLNFNGSSTVLAGTVGVSGTAGDGGPATSALLNLPTSVALRDGGGLYIADTHNSVIRAVLPDSTIVLVAGTYTAGYSTGAGVATAAMLNLPWQVATDGTGGFFLSDGASNCIVRHVTSAGGIVDVVGTYLLCDHVDGAPPGAKLNAPQGIVSDGAGGVVFVEGGNCDVRAILPGTGTQSPTGSRSASFSMTQSGSSSRAPAGSPSATRATSPGPTGSASATGSASQRGSGSPSGTEGPPASSTPSSSASSSPSTTPSQTVTRGLTPSAAPPSSPTQSLSASQGLTASATPSVSVARSPPGTSSSTPSPLGSPTSSGSASPSTAAVGTPTDSATGW